MMRVLTILVLAATLILGGCSDDGEERDWDAAQGTGDAATTTHDTGTDVTPGLDTGGGQEDLSHTDLVVGDAAADAGTCQQTGQPCGDTHGECCEGLMCCSGVPVPPGQEYCAVDCPISDRNAKRGFTRVDTDDVLQRVSGLPISTWSYKNDPRAARHMGPMAQDFRQEFALGSSERFISPVDADGVSLAAIQALYGLVQQLHHELTLVRSDNEELRQAMEAMQESSGRGCRERR